MLTVFLSSSASGRQQLVLEGWLPVPRDGTWGLPRIDVESAGRRDTNIFVYRQPDVQAAIVAREGLVDIDRSQAIADPQVPGRLVAALSPRADEFSAALRIAPNAPRVRSTQVASIARERDAWEGRIDYQCTVEDGSLDAILIQLPPQWSGPFEASPSGTLEILDTPDGDRRLSVRPQIAVEAEFHCTIRGAVQLSEGSMISPPSVVATAGEESVSYLLLPTVVASERFAWKTTGLAQDVLPDAASGSALPAGYRTYRVTEPVASASRIGDRLTSDSGASTADVRVGWNLEGPCQGIAKFVVNAAELNDCTCTIPDGIEVLEVRRSGRPVTPAHTADGWKIPLVEGREQQVIEIVYRASPAAISLAGRVTLVAPSLTRPQVGRTTWTVYSPAAAGHVARAEAQGEPLTDGSADSINSPPDDPLAATFGAGTQDRWSFAGGGNWLVIRYSAVRRLAGACSAVAAILLVAIGTVLARHAAGDGRWRATFLPALLGFFAGLLAVAWINPSWPGAVLVLASVLILLWPAVRRQRAAADPATDVASP